jgi:hypothetical protein
MNFWEAREAALTGKKVRLNRDKISHTATGVVFTARDFENSYLWCNEFIAAEWEVEEPKTITKYIGIYKGVCGYSMGIPYFAVNDITGAKNPDLINIIALTVDVNGMILEAKNI